MTARRLILTCLLMVTTTAAVAAEIGFVEDFALAPDRTVPLKQLIPGTEDFYYYHALHFQNTEQFDKVDETLKLWIKRYGYTAPVREILNRQRLLTFEQQPQPTLAYLQQELQLRFDHQRELLDQKPNLPTRLDPDLISRAALTKQALARHRDLQDFEPSALDWLVASPLDADRRRHLLSRLSRPDYPNLVQLVVDDLKYQHSGGFGSLNIHRQLLLAQLDKCLTAMPDLVNQTNFVNTYLTKLHPDADVDWRNDPAVLEAFLDRQWSFVSKLGPVHNSLKAHVLYHRLVLDRSRGTYDHDRFLHYLQLPRPVSYIEPKFMQLEDSRRYPCNLSADFQPVTLLPPIGDDEPLVRSYLLHFFVEAAGYKPYEPYVQDDYLKHAFAETKIVNGLGDAEQWYSLLPPELYQQLKARVDLDFAYTNKTQFAPDAPISLDLLIKNVETLIVKAYEINTGSYYREQLREVDTDINLDGLVANEEFTFKYQEPPLRRVRRRFDFPKLNGRGVYVIDFIGNGISSRALVRKGKLRYLARTSTAGHVVTILDEENKQLDDATLWLAGHLYEPDTDGLITLPFSNQPGRQAIVLSHGEFSSLEHFHNQSENYHLQAAIYVDRESLLSRKHAQVIVRPSLRMNGVPVTLSVLQDVRLLITSTDLDGVATTKEVPDFQLHEDRESTYEIQVPRRLASIGFALQAKVQNLSQNKKIDLSAEQAFTLNGIDRSDKTEDLHLANIDGAFVLDVLGKSGETRADRPVQLSLKHRDFRQPVNVSLQSDAQGRVALGRLDDIVSITATGPEGTARTWTLPHDSHTYHQVVQGRADEPINLPYLGRQRKPARDELSLLELRGNTYVADRFDALSIKHGMLQIDDLPPGDYDLLIKPSATNIRIRLTKGPARHGIVLGNHRQLELRTRRPLQIEKIDVGPETLTVKLQNASKFSRVHVFATRYQPAYAPFSFLAHVRDIEPHLRILPSQDSVYKAGRNIGDEYRYIIDRKYATKLPGNMLDRPSLLLNPWAIRATETSLQDVLEGEGFGGGGGGLGGMQFGGDKAAVPAAGASDFANLDFLDHGSAVLLNLTPDADGQVTIDRKLLGPHQDLHIVAVDPLTTTYRTLALPEIPRQPVDLRLIVGLDPEAHYTQQKQITMVPAGQDFQLSDITSSRFELYDNLPRVYALYMTLSGDTRLAEFSFVMNWHKLKPDERQTLYSKYACHELSFFLKQKDPQFFAQVVRPYLQNKKDQTFLDRWLLDDNLADYLQPWNFGQLNMVERILLAQRIKGESPRTARYVAELFDLIPPDPERFNHLFQTALQGRELETHDALGLRDATDKAKTVRRDEEMRKLGDLKSGGERLPSDGPVPVEEDRAADPQAPPAPDSAPQNKSQAAKKAEEKGAQKPRQPARGDQKDAAGELVEEAADELAEGYFDDDADLRQSARQFYRKLDKTQEWVENNYYNLPVQQQNADLVTVNAFWRDYASHDQADKPFYSVHLAEASRNFTEMMFALSLLDLPMEGAEHKTEFADGQMKLSAASPLVAYHEEILPSARIAQDTPILVSQNFFRHSDRYRFEGNQRLDKYVTDEFLIHVVYGCQVVVTNPTSSPRKLDVLLQIPVGAMPVLAGQATRSVQLDLQPYQTSSLEYYFYFPAPGEFNHYPVHVSQQEQLLAYAEPITLNVVRQLSRVDRESWDYVSQHGSDEDVIKYLQANNLNRTNLDRIAFRMQDQGFFRQVIRLLTARHAYNHTLWSYGIKHGFVPAISQYLQHEDRFVQQCGDYLVSPLLLIDPVSRKTYEHIDYRPLVAARAHQLGRRPQILNDRLHEQYHRLMKILSYRRQLDDRDRMAVTYYMLLQNRTVEALDFFRQVDPDRLQTRLQYDYFTAYLDCYSPQPQRAAVIAARYADHPVDRWRNAFANVSSQLKEIGGAAAEIVDDEDRAQQQARLAATAPSFEFRVESRRVVLNYQNLSRIEVNYYLMDIELLFSSNPFVQQVTGQFSYIRPNLTQIVELEAGATTKTFELPAELHNSNTLVEIRGGPATKSQAYYANSLSVQMVENYGQLRVTHAETSKPLSTVYVKVYAQTKDGGVRFYKDGYTDLRGRFDYASLSTNELDFVEKFSILLLSQRNGAVVREAQPPKQ